MWRILNGLCFSFFNSLSVSVWTWFHSHFGFVLTQSQNCSSLDLDCLSQFKWSWLQLCLFITWTGINGCEKWMNEWWWGPNLHWISKSEFSCLFKKHCLVLFFLQGQHQEYLFGYQQQRRGHSSDRSQRGLGSWLWCVWKEDILDRHTGQGELHCRNLPKMEFQFKVKYNLDR